MSIELLPNMDAVNDGQMLNWVALLKIIESKSPFNLKLSQTHRSVKSKLTFSDYHYHILNQFYQPNQTLRTKDTECWVRAESQSIVASLYSALDSLAYEINLVYNFGLKPSDIHIHHGHTNPTEGCFRCSLTCVNDSLTSFLNSELSSDWFERFRKLRNQMMHKNIPVLNLAIGDDTTHILVPNDPTNMNPQFNDYSDNLEINSLCQNYKNKVLAVVEKTYQIIQNRVSSL